MLKRIRPLAALLLLVGAAACTDESPLTPDPTGGADPDTVRPSSPVTLPVLGQGVVSERYSAELAVRGATAYTTTWGNRAGNNGNSIKIWDVSGSSVRLVDSVRVERAGTLGDVQISDDGKLLVVAAEYNPNGALLIYDLTIPREPRLVTRYETEKTKPGVHTAEVARVNGVLYAFLSVDPVGGLDAVPARLVVVDLTDPASPREVFAREMGRPYVHDVFVRDGYLFTALWDDGLTIWDIGGGGRAGASPANPVQVSNVRTAGGNVHNVWWVHDPVTGSKRYAIVGEEQGGSPTAGDVHVVDVSDLASPREVAFFRVPGAGTHNFWVDEESGYLYAAYYNGGVRVLDVRGDLGTCTAAQQSADGRCDLALMGREVGRALVGRPVSIWGVQLVGMHLYATDMQSGLFKLDASALLRR